MKTAIIAMYTLQHAISPLALPHAEASESPLINVIYAINEVNMTEGVWAG
jgi:hypothetical protein